MLFDVDGTLVDSSYIHTLAWWQAFRQAGYDVPMASIHRSVGMGGDRILDSLLPSDRDASEDSTIMTSHAAVFSTFWPALRPLDGAKELLAQCHESGLAVALASSARERDLEALRSTIGADAFIDAATSSSDAQGEQARPGYPRRGPGSPGRAGLGLRSMWATPSGTSTLPGSSIFRRSD